MIPKACKRLAEVDFPIAEVSRHAAREKSIRHGHPSTLHLWWARRPLASSRAVLLALLLPDPCDPYCPPEFKAEARELLLAMRGRASGWESTVKTDEGLRQVLLKFIADFANWDNAAKAEYLETGRGLVQSAHPEETPLVVDPFAGGGSIPLEALRLGCEAFASDLNPVACLILKVMLEDIPRHGPSLADELRKAGGEIKAKAEKELADLYPKDPDGATPIAYLWARTVRCESPNCGAEIPLMRSMWLSKKPNRRRALRPLVVEEKGLPPQVEFEIFEPKSEREVPNRTVSSARATCICCQAVMTRGRVTEQLKNQRGGADAVFDQQGDRIGGARLIAVVTLKAGQKGRYYRLPNDGDYQAVRMAQQMISSKINHRKGDRTQGMCPFPDEPTPIGGGTGAGRAFGLRNYGMLEWGDLFTARQKAGLNVLGRELMENSGVVRPVSLALGKLADLANAFCPWEPKAECPRNVLSQGRFKPGWDFAEGVVISDASGGFTTCIENLAKGVQSVRGIGLSGQSEVAAAQHSPLPSETATVWFTDPPYDDQIPYADLSDFFYTWYRRAIPDYIRMDPFDAQNDLTPKELEAVNDETRLADGKPKDRSFFQDAMARAFADGKRVVKEDGIGTVVFAHQTTEGWEALLSGMIRGGWTITGSWPVATEQAYRLRARDSAALATSVHLVCRPRSANAPVGEWADVLRELPVRVGDWMQRLQNEGVRGADLVFACVGPALEIYSRYSDVETAEGRRVELPEYLERVWEVVGREALEQVLGTAEARARNGAAGALEEDARLTALFLWTLQSTGDAAVPANGAADESEEDMDDEYEAPRRRVAGYSLPFDVVRRFAQPLGIHLDEWESRIIKTDKGVVRLRPVTERGKELFDESGTGALADEIEPNAAASGQLSLFPNEPPAVRGRSRRRGRLSAASDASLDAPLQATTLDRVHASMMFQAAGRTEALRNLLRAEQERGPDFLRLANALSALYPRGSEEKRLLDGMLLAAPR